MGALQKFPEIDDQSGGLNGSMIDYLSAILYGGKCIADRSVNITNGPAIGFGQIAGGIPAGAKSALVVIEADGAAVNSPRVVRFTQDGATVPTAAIGMSVGDNGSFEIRGTANIANFRIIGITAGQTHVMRVQFFGQG